MSDIVIYLSLSLSLITVLLLAVMLFKGKRNKTENETEATPVQTAARTGAPPVPGIAPRGVRAQRNVRNRMRVAATRQQASDEEDEDYDPLADEIALPDGKIGAKKRKKLEQKAEKRAARERELEEREERKQRQQAQEEQRKKDEELLKLEEAQKEEEEIKLKEEKEKQELEEYLKMKEAFAVEEEGFDENETEEQGQKFQDFIDYIEKHKVVMLEDLAAQFKLKTQDCIDRVQTLLEEEQLTGVIDDRGKFISITPEELQAVAKFIRQRGRILISELVESSNQLIRLQQPSETAT